MLKFDWNKKYTTIAVYVCIVIAFAIAVLLLGLNFNGVIAFFNKIFSVLTPILIGGIFAYLLLPILNFFERNVFGFVEKKKPRKKLRRGLSLAVTYIIVFALLISFFLIFVPQIVNSYSDFDSKITGYISSAQKWADDFVRNSALFNGKYSGLSEFLDVNDITAKIQNLISNSYNILDKVVNYVLNYGSKLVLGTKNVIVGLCFSLYFLISKEKLSAGWKKIASAFLKKENVTKLTEFARYSDKTFGGFVFGQIVDSIIVAIVSFIVFAIFNMPYYPLIAVIVGVTNVIPFFGPFLGAIPSAFIIFIARPEKVLTFIIIVIIMQQIDGNIICPKIVGTSIGMSSLGVLTAVIVMGGFFGIIGMFLGVPIFAIICMLIKNYINKKLAQKELSCNTMDYYVEDPEPRKILKINFKKKKKSKENKGDS